MENVLQYLKWRGDISFKERQFNEIDALVCALLGYVEWDGIIDKEKVLLSKACQMNLKLHPQEEMLITYAYSPMIIDLIKMIPTVSRYKNVTLKRYQSVLDEDKSTQFAAVTIELDNSVYYISYRGTDRTILGWKEDFEMTFLDSIPSQQMALEYLKQAYKDIAPRKVVFSFKSAQVPSLYLGGHSKGGNLAMYAAICCEEMKQYIKYVYSFDGPGFKDSFYEKHDYHSIMDRICNYTPEGSLIGRLMIHKEKYVIFHGYDNGLQQHDGFYWKINTDHFDYVDVFNEDSNRTMDYMNNILLSKSDEELKEFISLIFEILKDIKIHQITDFTEISFAQAFNGLKELRTMNLEDSKIFLEFLKLVYLQIKSVYFTKKKGT